MAQKSRKKRKKEHFLRIVFDMTVLTERHLLHSKGVSRARGQRIKRGVRRILKREALRQYRAGEIVTDICRSIGIARGTFYSWLARDPQFQAGYQAIVDAREAIEQAEFERFMANIERQKAALWANMTNATLCRLLNQRFRSR
jgi:hypothetical protein